MQEGTRLLRVAESSSGSAGTLAALAEGSDLDGAAEAVAAQLKKDPTDAEARAAVDAVFEDAEAAARAGDVKRVARDLALAAKALGQSTVTRRPVQMLEKGDLKAAAESFGLTTGAMKKRGPEIVALLRVKELRSSLDAGGMEGAESLRDLLRSRPEDPDGKKAFEAILARIGKAAKKGDGKAAAQASREAVVASGAGADQVKVVEEAAAAMAENMAAIAEVQLEKAKKGLPSSKVVDAVLDGAKTLRAQAEKAALKALPRVEDPRPSAEALSASLAVSPTPKVVEKGRKIVLGRARKAAKKGDALQLSRTLSAAGRLDPALADAKDELDAAAEKLASGELGAAEAGFAELPGEVGPEAAKLVHQLRVGKARAAVTAAAKKKDVLAEAQANAKLLELSPGDRAASKRAKSLSKRVKSSRLDTARAQLELGKPGVTWVYAMRALEASPGDEKAVELKKKAEALLAERKDLIIVIEAVEDAAGGSGSCAKLAPALQAAAMEQLSKRTDLGGYVLSESWTKAWREGHDKAPKVSGGLQLAVDRCGITPSTGEAGVSWKLLTPREGKVTAEGTLAVDVPEGFILADQRDAAGENARAKLVDRIVDELVDGLKVEGVAVKSWLLTTAEAALAREEPEAAADAFARFSLDPPRSASKERVSAIEAALRKAFP